MLLQLYTQLGRSTKVLGNIKIPTPVNFTFNWEDQQRYDDVADDDDADDAADDDDDDDALPVVVAVRGKAQAFAVYIYRVIV